MLSARITPNAVGIEIVGDPRDFGSLRKTLYTVASEDLKIVSPETANFVLALAYEIRHAEMGDRGFQEITLQFTEPQDDLKASDKKPSTRNNTYVSCRIFLLDYLLQIHILRNLHFYPLLTDKLTKRHIANLILLESLAQEAIYNADSEIGNHILGIFNKLPQIKEDYLTSFLTTLNYQYLTKHKDRKRYKYFSEYLKLMSSDSEDYKTYKKNTEAEAEKRNCSVHSVEISCEMPGKIVW